MGQIYIILGAKHTIFNTKFALFCAKLMQEAVKIYFQYCYRNIQKKILIKFALKKNADFLVGAPILFSLTVQKLATI